MTTTERAHNSRRHAGSRLELLVDLVTQVAQQGCGGHVSLLRFGSGWKAAFGTPDLHGNSSWPGTGYAEVLGLDQHPSLEDALEALLAEPLRFEDVEQRGRARMYAALEEDRREALKDFARWRGRASAPIGDDQ